MSVIAPMPMKTRQAINPLLNLEEVHEFFQVARQRIDEERTDGPRVRHDKSTHLAGFQHHQSAVDGNHTDAQRQHYQGFQDFLVGEPDKDQPEGDQQQPAEGDGWFGDEEGVDTLEELEEEH